MEFTVASGILSGCTGLWFLASHGYSKYLQDARPVSEERDSRSNDGSVHYLHVKLEPEQALLIPGDNQREYLTVSERTCDIYSKLSLGWTSGPEGGVSEGADTDTYKYAVLKRNPKLPNVDLSNLLPRLHSKFATHIMTTERSCNENTKVGLGINLITGEPSMNVSSRVGIKTRYYGVPSSGDTYLILGNYSDGSFMTNSNLMLERNTDIHTLRDSASFSQRVSGISFGVSTAWFATSLFNMYRSK